jgi:hypothetical protein
MSRDKILVLALLLPLMAKAGDPFLTELEDMPLAPGLVEEPGGLLFDSADGRIVETSASGDVTAEQVRRFYSETLRQLGWRMNGPLEFRRDNEILHLVIDESHKPLTLHFKLTPAK